MKRIIVNADDFGINEVVTSEIERQILAKNVSSTTVMANGNCLNEVKNFANQHPEISFGIHLCLSEFDSLSKSDGLKQAGIIGEDGKFIHKAIFHLDNLKNNDVQKAIREELNAQIDVVSSLGIPISHADSHHHVHTIFQLKEIFADVLKKRGLNKIRLGADFHNWRSKRHLILWSHRMLLNRFYRSCFSTTDAFYSYNDYLRFGLHHGEDVVELMCHPGHKEKIYQDEIKSVEAKVALNNDCIKLISYNDL